MTTMRHLDEDELAAAVAGLELEKTAGEHLAGCLECHRRAEGVRAIIDARRAEVMAGAPDWEAQRAAVVARLGEVPQRRSARRWQRPALAAAAVIVMAVGVALLQLPGGNGSDQELPVEEILAEADALLASESIPGFEIIDPNLDELDGFLSNGVS